MMRQDAPDTRYAVRFDAFTVTYGLARSITAVSHSHADGTEHDCIPDFDSAEPAYECLDCGDHFAVIVDRKAS